MTTRNKDAQIPMARCAKCDHDLIASKNGKVFCSNIKSKCVFVKKPYPTGSMPNEGRVRFTDAD